MSNEPFPPGGGARPSPSSASRIAERGRAILEQEGNAILCKARSLSGGFARLVERILELKGHVAITGVGKSGIIGEKISATLSSTGTPSFYIRPVDALHGDLGMIGPGDLLIAISNSGETAEVLAAVGAASALGVEIVGFTGAMASSLARASSIVVDTGVEREACPLGLAPTTSTTVTLAVGDALAMVLLEERGFTREHYARFHPGGSLGQRLKHKVLDIMRSGDLVPRVDDTDTLAAALREMTVRENIGITLVTSPPSGVLAGVLTDGDLRRILMRAGPDVRSALSSPVGGFMSRRPVTIEAEASAAEALQAMEVRGITSLAVINHLGQPEGIIHLHDILGRGKIVL
ncbi:MAG: KpsF/GutQ family sugar-phosphate isomerase [Planctomycetes bacterium]|nr:KpsF/GutQ family sugar-phosphate isomerase [Planctomycetota bacterium]